MICEVCGHNNFHVERVERTFHIGDKLVLVEGIPAEVCDRCGAANFAASVAEQVRVLVHGSHPSGRPVSAEAIRYEAA